MRYIGADELSTLLSYQTLVPALETAFTSPPVVPQRQHYDIDPTRPGDVTYLMMPAWQTDGYIGTKLVSVIPSNAQQDLPTVSGFYMLADAKTGEPLLMLDAAELTARRTAGISALATRYLARADSGTLLMVGTGKLASYLIEANATVRSVERVLVWGRDRRRSATLVASLSKGGYRAEVVDHLQQACNQADIICCATSARVALVHGKWLRPGTHLDLTGAYRADMREVDDAAVLQARIFVDTREGALSEGGDLVQPIRAGLMSEEAIIGELSDLLSGQRTGRSGAEDFTLFKSVGTAISDYGAAVLVYHVLTGSRA